MRVILVNRILTNPFRFSLLLLCFFSFQTFSIADTPVDYINSYYSACEKYNIWESSPVKIYIEQSNKNQVSVVKAAFLEWQKALNNKIKFSYTNKKKDADIIVDFIQDININDLNTANISSYTNVYSYNGTIYKAQINLKGNDISADDLYINSLHEIGHALGINKHSKNKQDVMYLSINEKYKKLSENDKDTINFLYDNSQKNKNSVCYDEYKYKSIKAREEQFKDNALVKIELGNEYKKRKEYQKAIEQYQNALKINDSFSYKALYPLAVSQYYIGEYNNAYENIKKILEYEPENLSYVYFYISICKIMGKNTEANEYIKKMKLNNTYNKEFLKKLNSNKNTL